MRILVTGATGFIGKERVKHLIDAGNEVVAIGNQHRETIAAIQDSVDIAERDALKYAVSRYRPDRIEHFASQAIVKVSREDAWTTYRTNVLGAVSTLEVAKSANIPIMMFTTDKVYGDREVSTEDDSPIICSGTYETSKTCQDIIAQSYRAQGVDVTIVRSCNVFGASDPNRRIIPNTLRTLKEGKSPLIFDNIPGFRQYIYLKDLMTALDTILSQGNEWVFNVGTDIKMHQAETVQKMIDIWNDVFKTEIAATIKSTSDISQTQEIKSQFLNWSRLHQNGWHPRYTFEEAIKEIISIEQGALWIMPKLANG